MYDEEHIVVERICKKSEFVISRLIRIVVPASFSRRNGALNTTVPADARRSAGVDVCATCFDLQGSNEISGGCVQVARRFVKMLSKTASEVQSSPSRDAK